MDSSTENKMNQDRLKGVTRPGSAPLVSPHPHSPMTFQNRIMAEVVGPDGEVKQRVDHYGNLLLTYGANSLVEMLASDAGGASDWVSACAIGTSSTAVGYSDTGLGASTQIAHLSQASMVASDAGARTLQYNMTFASNGNACTVNEIGLCGTNSATTRMIARSVLGTDSLDRGASDEVRATYQMICQSC